MTEEFKQYMAEQSEKINIHLSEPQTEKFYQYYELLIEWNQVMNLTAITEMKEVVIKHFIDSLSLIKACEDLETGEYRVIDVGTGAGFPGIPLKIVFPALKITLLDSLNKRVKFLNEVIERLGLIDINAVHGRAEDYGRDKMYRERYDICVSRAVANLSTLSEYCLPFVKAGGFFLSYKSGAVDEELLSASKAVALLGGEVEQVIRFTLAGTDAERSFIKIKKIKTMPGKYPRKAGLPSKEPLK